ncbi:lanthionine synthetase LanC family protein [Epilithonimonas vandammei]|uniref:Lanthionine synthetase n=1 Tax=Epilithonimonas vandammei TaxID=2487072 RepID=A0A3G8XZB6_9FLAO|nr:lanthionine synthetase LanC family protein [Epilithonimonas vandammei]AZI38612.1 hypothetical protein EIB74_00920 [Epilithonimonas vandammei]
MNIENKLLDIERAIDQNWNKQPYISDLSLLTGISGIPIFYYMLYHYNNDPKYLNKIDEVLNAIFERLNEGEETIPKTYCLGLAGIAYMLNFLDRSENVKIDLAESLQVLDEILLDTIDYFLSYIDNIEKEFIMEQADFLHGVSGIAHYFLSRDKKETYSEKITALLEKLAEIVEWDYQRAIEVKDIEHITTDMHKTNIGLAHGHISFILLFSKYLELFSHNNRVKQALESSVKTVLLFKNEQADGFCLFPSIAVNKKTARYNIHLGWCYGDQSVSYGLYKAGLILNDENLITISKEIALSTLKRDSLKTALLNEDSCDAGFCHGTISVAYYHKKWYLITGDTRFLELYKKFTQFTLSLSNEEKGLAGYLKNAEAGDKKAALGLLDGIAGIGVFFIDSLLNESSSVKWDSVFLIE